MTLKAAQLDRARELIGRGLEFLLGEREGARAAWAWLRSCKDLLEGLDAAALEEVTGALGWDSWAEMLVRERLGVNLSRDTIKSVVNALDSLFTDRGGHSVKGAMLLSIASDLIDSGAQFVVGKLKSSEDAWAWLEFCASLFDVADDQRRRAKVRQFLTIEELGLMKGRALLRLPPPKEPLTEVVRLLDEFCQGPSNANARRRL